MAGRDGSELVALPEDPTSFPTPTLGDSQTPATPVSRDLMLPLGPHEHQHSSLYTNTQTHIHMLK